MKITLSTANLLNLETLKRFQKKFDKNYKFGVNGNTYKQVEQMLPIYEMIEKDGEPVGYIKRMIKNVGDWTGKNLFQTLDYIDVEYVEPNERGKGIITQARNLIFKKYEMNTVSISFKHILDGLDYWQNNGFKYLIKRKDDSANGNHTILFESLFYITQQDDLIENRYVRKLTKDNLLQFVKDFRHYSFNALKEDRLNELRDMFAVAPSNNNKKRIDEYYEQQKRFFQSQTDELLEQLLEVA